MVLACESGLVDRRGSKSCGSSIFGVGQSSSKDKNAKEQGKATSEESKNPLGFTSHRTPLSYVGRNAVLVQVWAIRLDGMDALEHSLVSRKALPVRRMDLT